MAAAGDGINLRPSAGMAAAAARGLELHKQGRSGDGLKPETVSRAGRIARREMLTPAHVREMRAWFRRHKVDRRPGWGDRGTETPGYTAWMLWGGDPGWKWSEVKVAQMERRLEKRDADQSTPAPPGDQIKGSDKNEAGSAEKPSTSIDVSDPIRKALQSKVISHNAAMRKEGRPKWSKATLGQLLAVYRRGAGAYSTSHRPNVTRGAWAMARVNAYLHLLRSGSPRDSKYVTDNDLLPSGHPKKTEQRDADIQRLEVRARGAMRGKKRPRMRTPQSPVKMGAFAGCGTGAGGFKPGNRCGKEDGIPNAPTYLGRKGFAKVGEKSDPVDRAKLKEQISAGRAKAEAKQKARMADDRKKSIQIKRQKAAVRKAAKDKADSEAAIAQEAARKAARKAKLISIKRKKAAERKKAKEEAEKLAAQKEAEAKAAKKAEMLKKIRMKNASKKLTIASTPKSIADEIKELKYGKANAQLNVVGTPPSIEEQIADAKIAAAFNPPVSSSGSRWYAALEDEVTARASGTPPANKGTFGSYSAAAVVGYGKPLDYKAEEAARHQHDEERNWLFGPSYGRSATGTERVEMKQKIAATISKRMESLGVRDEDITDDDLKNFGDAYLKMQNIPPDVPKEYHRRYALAGGVVDQWASSSGDSQAKSVGIQFAIADVLGVKGALTSHLNHKESGSSRSSFDAVVDSVRKSKAVRAAVQAQYQITQEHLRKLGIKKLKVARGYGSSAKPGSSKRVRLQPASSFTTHARTAEQFSVQYAGGYAKQRIVVSEFSADRIFSTCVTGNGCLEEEEIVVLGGSVIGDVYSRRHGMWST